MKWKSLSKSDTNTKNSKNNVVGAWWPVPGSKKGSLKPNTRRRRRRDETVESRRVGVGGVYWALFFFAITALPQEQTEEEQEQDEYSDMGSRTTTRSCRDPEMAVSNFWSPPPPVQLRLLLVLLYIQMGDRNLIIIIN